MVTNFKQIRQHYRQQRRCLDSTIKQQAETIATQHLLALPAYQAAKHIGSYQATPEEFNPDQIVQHARKHSKQTYLPVVDKERMLQFFTYTEATELLPNRFDILEPSILSSTPISIDKLDLILVPLVAFDTNCQRLGMGGGYYDCALANTKTQTGPIKIGLAYECQHADTLAMNAWDIPMDYVITEKMVYQR